MLSYRHAFHAGNHADVFKHAVLLFTLNYLTQKDKALCYIDTHAGAGSYSLRDAYAEKNAEYKDGVEKLLAAKCKSSLLQNYQTLIKQLRKQHGMFCYPGSPHVAAHTLRELDRLQLCELHNNEFENLQAWAHRDKRILCKHIDGFSALASFLPPREKRGLVLIDPPYEIKQDYRQVLEALKQIASRFSNGTVILWYPLLNRDEVKQLQRKLDKWKGAPCLHAYYALGRVDSGMPGSGLFIMNPPWTLHDAMQQALEEMVRILAFDETARFSLQKIESGL